MIYRVPDYVKKFRCIADKCGDSCCIGWEIDIDEETAEYYESVEGEFGKRLRENISDKCFILDKNERCPFLNEKNLCDIYINLGEENLCQICTDHPRYYEWFEGVKEGGIGLSCEEAARIILESDFSLCETETENESCSEYDKKLYELLSSARDVIFTHIKNDEIKELVCSLAEFASDLQYNADNCIYELPEWKKIRYTGKNNVKEILRFYTGLEPIDSGWIPYIKKCADLSEKISNDNSEFEIYIRRLLSYFVFRYFMKGVFDGEFFSFIMFALLSTGIILYLWKCSKFETGSTDFADCVRIARNYSKEIEYCEENTESVRDAFYTSQVFSTENISALF